MVSGFEIPKVYLLVGGVYLKENYCYNRYAIDRYGDFWDDPSEYDVWILGSSHTYYSLYPMVMYQQFGFTSYDVGTPSGTPAVSYWILMNALRKGKPEVVLVDVYHLDLDYPLALDQISKKTHIGFDAIPFSSTKVRAINDLVTDGQLRRELYLPIYRENGPRSTIVRKSEKHRFRLNKGAMVSVETEPIDPRNNEDVLEQKTLQMEYLEKIIDECKKNDIQIVVTALPFNTGDAKLAGLNTGLRIAKEKGVAYFDMQCCPDVINYDCDFTQDGHLNVSGARKMSAILGEWLTTNFDLTDHRKLNDDVREKWNNKLPEYEKYINHKIKAHNKRLKNSEDN